jgi:hypothetical protein
MALHLNYCCESHRQRGGEGSISAIDPAQELNGSGGGAANLLTGQRIDEFFTRTDTATSTSAKLHRSAWSASLLMHVDAQISAKCGDFAEFRGEPRRSRTPWRSGFELPEPTCEHVDDGFGLRKLRRQASFNVMQENVRALGELHYSFEVGQRHRPWVLAWGEQMKRIHPRKVRCHVRQQPQRSGYQERPLNIAFLDHQLATSLFLFKPALAARLKVAGGTLRLIECGGNVLLQVCSEPTYVAELGFKPELSRFCLSKNQERLPKHGRIQLGCVP